MTHDIDYYRMLCSANPRDKPCPAYVDGRWPECCYCYQRSKRPPAAIMAAICMMRSLRKPTSTAEKAYGMVVAGVMFLIVAIIYLFFGGKL